MFGTDHKDHKFEHLEKVYERHLKDVKSELEFISQQLSGYVKMMEKIRGSIDYMQKTKEDKEDELVRVMALLKEKLEQQLKEKLMILLSEKNVIGDEINYLEKLQDSVKNEISSSSKSALVTRSKELIKTISEVKARPTISLNGFDISPEFPSELVPEYIGGTFELPNFTQCRKATPNHFFSSPLVSNGLVWRLKVYPNGNGPSKGSFLAVFFCMEEGLEVATKYEYKLELVNHRNPQLTVVRESVSEFVASDCWGYPKFMHIEDLYKEGYLTPDEEKLVIRFYIRAPLYSQHAKDQKVYITKLEQKIKTMQENLDKYEKTCSEKGIKVEVKNLEEEVKKKSPEKSLEANSVRAFVPSNTGKEEEKKQVKPATKASSEPISLEDMIKNIEIDPPSGSEGEAENSSDEEESKGEADIYPNEPLMLSPEIDDNEVLKEISNRYAAGSKIGKKVLLHIKNRKMEEEKGGFMVVKKGSVSARGSPDERDRSTEQVNRSSLIYNYKDMEEGIVEEEENSNINNVGDIN